jgi:hypothetical protein
MKANFTAAPVLASGLFPRQRIGGLCGRDRLRRRAGFRRCRRVIWLRVSDVHGPLWRRRRWLEECGHRFRFGLGGHVYGRLRRGRCQVIAEIICSRVLVSEVVSLGALI